MQVDVGGGTRLFFDVVGSGLEQTPDALAGKPALILLHGGPGSITRRFGRTSTASKTPIR